MELSVVRRTDGRHDPASILMGSTGIAPELKSLPGGSLLPVNVVGRPVFTTWRTDNAVRFGYKSSSWVYACVTKRMKAAASVPLRIESMRSDGRWEETASPELARLIKQPNPWMSWQDMTETIASHLDLGGNAILSKVRVRGKPAELWVLRPDRVRPVPSRSDYIAYYEYNLDGVKKKLDAKDIIHFRYIDPANEFWGISPLMAGSKTVDMEIEAVKWNFAAMQNRAVPDGMISLKKEMTRSQFVKANDYLEDQLMGRSNAHRPFIMGYEADYKRFSLTPAEMDFIKSRQLTREEICAIFGVPPPLVGIYDKATLTNIQTARLIFWEDTMVPFLDDLQDVWNFSLVPDFGENLRIVYDMSGVPALRAAFKERVDTGRILFAMGVPFNDVNQRLSLGFDDIPGGDVGYIATNLEPVIGAGDFFDDTGGGRPVPTRPAPEDEE